MTTSTLRQRPMEPGDSVRWAELLAVVEAADVRGESYDADDCAEELADPELDLALDTVLMLDGDLPVAYQVLHRRGFEGPDRRLFADAAVHPEHRGRGIGTTLLALAQRRADALDARVVVRVAEANTGAVALLEGSGFRTARWWSELTRDLTRPVLPAPVPDGVEVHPLGPDFDGPRWDEPLRSAHNTAFADHWGSSPVDAQAWAHSRTGTRNFRPAASVAACDSGGAVVGYVLSYSYLADTARTGVRELYVATVGTLPAWRGRGMASALLARVLTAAAEQGYGRSALTVDSQNPTGALGVYERAGYVLDRREVSYARG